MDLLKPMFVKCRITNQKTGQLTYDGYMAWRVPMAENFDYYNAETERLLSSNDAQSLSTVFTQEQGGLDYYALEDNGDYRRGEDVPNDKNCKDKQTFSVSEVIAEDHPKYQELSDSLKAIFAEKAQRRREHHYMAVGSKRRLPNVPEVSDDNQQQLGE